MEHIVGIKFNHTDGSIGAFITWGRIFDRVDDDELLEVVSQFEFVKSPKLCRTLQGVCNFPNFYEMFWQFPSSETIPHNPADYQEWRKQKAQEMREGKWFYLLGYIKKRR